MADQRQPLPFSVPVRDHLVRGDLKKAIAVYRIETRLSTEEATRIITQAMHAQQQHAPGERPLTVVHRKQGTQHGVMTWYRKDVEAMARQGYAETSHQMAGVARGCAALFLPRMAEIVVTYHRLDGH